MSTNEPRPTDLDLVDGLAEIEVPTIHDYCAASAQYIREASRVGSDKGKAAQIRLSHALARVTIADLQARGLDLSNAVAGERKIGGALRAVNADVSEVSETEGVMLGVEIKPVHLAVGRAIWNRFGDIRTFAVNVHIKFPFAVLGGILTMPTRERIKSGDDSQWKETTHLVHRAIGHFVRAGGRDTEGDAPHLLEGVAVVVFDHETGELDDSLPPPGRGLRWDEFIDKMADAYDARFGVI